MAIIGHPLDLRELFVNYFAGSEELFFIIAIIFFAYLAAKFRIPSEIFLMLMAVFIFMLAGVGYMDFYVVIIFVIGLVLYWILSKMIKY